MADKYADEEWEEDALYEIAMAAAVVTVTASWFALPHIN